MDCPMKGCDKPVEPGPNCYVKVELGDKSKKKLVCEDCAQLHYDHLSS